MWEGVGDLKKTATYWPPPNSSGYHSLSFSFSWAAQPGVWGPSLCWDMVIILASSLQLIWTFCRWGYIKIWRPPTSCKRHNSHSIQPFDCQGCPLISLTGCTCYLHKCISSFDSLAGVSMLHWCQSWSNSLWQGYSCGLVHCPAGNATDLIWRVLASSQGISSWTSLQPQHSNLNPKPLANQLWCIDFLTPPTPLIIPRRLPAFLESLIPLKNRCSIYARCSKSSLKHSIRFCGIFPSLKQNFIAYRSFKVSAHRDSIFEIPQLWQSGFGRVYSNCCCSCSFKPEILKIGQSSHKMYSKNIVNFQEFTTILNACTKKSGILLKTPRIYQFIKKDVPSSATDSHLQSLA